MMDEVNRMVDKMLEPRSIREEKEWEFTTPNVDVDSSLNTGQEIALFEVPPGAQSVSTSGKTELKWELTFDARRNGVKSVGAHVPDQDITFSIDYDDVNGDMQQKEVTIKLTDVQTELYANDTMPADIQFWPDTVTLNADGTFTANFRIS